jgi:hypothetical protein
MKGIFRGGSGHRKRLKRDRRKIRRERRTKTKIKKEEEKKGGRVKVRRG